MAEDLSYLSLYPVKGGHRFQLPPAALLKVGNVIVEHKQRTLPPSAIANLKAVHEFTRQDATTGIDVYYRSNWRIVYTNSNGSLFIKFNNDKLPVNVQQLKGGLDG